MSSSLHRVLFNQCWYSVTRVSLHCFQCNQVNCDFISLMFENRRRNSNTSSRFFRFYWLYLRVVFQCLIKIDRFCNEINFKWFSKQSQVTKVLQIPLAILFFKFFTNFGCSEKLLNQTSCQSEFWITFDVY